ncbi:MAG: hypothetical protein HN712_10925 [Gemmatimonadetes bacterium]|jgi:hypothetical protein|nr:hypothetical protein [Gemmatimonadota bacterium]MBT6149955.1 hypothetical protein [Gemmatimonadota bacterium]MBT7860818.1 hypothetical protein [Gemmatimonadota bacterium]
MPARQLPDQPSLRHLRNEAKALRRSVLEADAEAILLVQAHVRRLQGLTPGNVSAASLGLQEAQHALACDYGFDGWSCLVEAIEPGLGLIGLQDVTRLAPRDAEALLRSADRRDLLYALAKADDLAGDIVRHLSPRVARSIEVLDLEGDRPSEQMIDESTGRILEAFRRLVSDGSILWPPVYSPAMQEVRPALDPRAQTLLHQSVPDLTQEELVTLLCALSDFVEKHGWNACEELADQASEFLGEGIRLIIDGTESPLVSDLLETRMLPLLQRRRMVMALMIEALFSAISGDNPSIVAYKVEVFYKESLAIVDAMDLPHHLVETARIDHLRTILHKGPWLDLSYDDMRDFFVLVSIISRREGFRGLGVLADDVQDRLFSLALRLMGEVYHPDLEEAPPSSGISPDVWLDHVETEMRLIIEDTYHRYQMTVEGLAALQRGDTAEATEAVIRSVARKPLDQIRGGRI